MGYSTLLERLVKKFPQAKIYYINENKEFLESFLERHSGILPHSEKNYDLEINSTDYQPWEMLQNIPTYLEEDLSLFGELSKWKSKLKPKLKRFELVGKDKHLYIHPSSQVYPGVVIDTTTGPVIIDKDVVITSFSFIQGPIYIGSESRIDNLRIGGGSVVGRNCRLGGEIENSIIQDYSNKHHEGFLGHSVLGSWVNMGALSTTSDLKNNYGTIEIQSGDNRVNTGTIKFGSIIGDFSKIGIGVMLNTGTTIDVGCNLVDSRITGYTPPFTWISAEKKYKLDRFLSDSKKIMARRSVNMSDLQEKLIMNYYGKLN
ncbi:MAG: glucose-1-phosphate thymidylyltransferase [Leptospira sp.]|nr:glucose-1-phosphate thymidylyltransferase [Leptospira sp.]